MLVTYEVTVRVIIDAPDGIDERTNNELLEERSAESGIDLAIKALGEDGMFDHFIEAKEDTELPFGTVSKDHEN